jgi:hypothetical protein
VVGEGLKAMSDPTGPLGAIIKPLILFLFSHFELCELIIRQIFQVELCV